jgi:hypothetical protein
MKSSGSMEFSNGRLLRSVEPTLRSDDDSLGEISQHRIGRRRIGTPCAIAARSLGLDPHDLASQQEAQIVLQECGDVAGERSERLAAEVGDIHRDATTWFKDPPAFGKHISQHHQVIEI